MKCLGYNEPAWELETFLLNGSEQKIVPLCQFLAESEFKWTELGCLRRGGQEWNDVSHLTMHLLPNVLLHVVSQVN